MRCKIFHSVLQYVLFADLKSFFVKRNHVVFTELKFVLIQQFKTISVTHVVDRGGGVSWWRLITTKRLLRIDH